MICATDFITDLIRMPVVIYITRPLKNIFMHEIIAFDFDGVICDSTEECLVTGYNAWLAYNGRGEFIYDPEQVPSDLAKYFRFRKGYVRTAGQYFAIFYSASDRSIKDDRDFEQICLRHMRQIKYFEALFFSVRDKLREHDVEYWISLHRLYEGVRENFKKLLKLTEVFIVTGKDKRSVDIFLRHNRIVFSGSKIFDKEAADNKLVALDRISNITHKDADEIIFIDDNIKHLLGPKKQGYIVYLAKWGYGLPHDIILAKQKKIPVISLEDWTDVVFDGLLDKK